MPHAALTTAALLELARQGDSTALSRLLAEQRSRLAAVAKQTLVASGKSFDDALQVSSSIEAEAKERFAEFTGRSPDDWTAWLDDMLRRKLGAVSAGIATSDTGQNPEMTLSRPASEGTANEGEFTLARPESPGTAPPGPESTLAPESERTLLPVKKPAPAGNIHAATTLAATGKEQVSATAGTKVFGDYDLLSKIAQGGMGVVYKARQRKLNRIVALKMILAGQFADELDVGRFYAEAESAANLRHPNIVGIHEVGEINGQHFFSMDYIEGKSLSDLVRENPLPPRDAAVFAQKIAAAMHYAHKQGILHRDLKPSNVLIDRSQEPLITDFGLAKRVGGQSQLTMSGTILGTPSYMPPEQASGKAEAAGPESDVYSMGAILYELLTGAPPFRAATAYETIRQVLERDPIAPRQANPSVPQDLETICVKCLQKEPSRRYASAEELAAELGRYLAGEPILARPVGPAERAWRWCRRNPLIASLAAAAALGVVLALVGTSVGYRQTARALRISEQSRRDQQEAVDELFTSVSENTLLNAPGMQPLRQELLQKALKYYERFLEQRGQDPTVADELALTKFRVGVITEAMQSPTAAQPHYLQAAESQREIVGRAPHDPEKLEALGNTLLALGRVHHKLHELEAAEEFYREAIEIRAQLVAAAPEVGEYKRQLASSHMNFGIFEQQRNNADTARRELEEAQRIRNEAVALGQGSLKLRRDLGKGYYELAVFLADQAAEANFRQAIEVFTSLLSDDAKNLEYQNFLVLCERGLADHLALRGEGEAAEKKAAAQATWEEASKLYEQALRAAEPLAQRNPDVVDYQVALAGVLMNWGYLEQYNLLRGEKALAAYRRAAEILTPLVKSHPSVPQYRRDLAATERAVGELATAARQWAEARARLESSRGHCEELVRQFPGSAEFLEERDKTAAALEMLGKTAPK